MNKRKGILEFLNLCNNNTNYNQKISNNSQLSRLVEKLCEFFHEHFIMRDIEEERTTYHQLKYEMLYFEEDKPNFERIANEIGVTIDTLKHHIRKYNHDAFVYIQNRGKSNFIYETLKIEFLRHEYSAR